MNLPVGDCPSQRELREVEKYAARMEAALEHIRFLCKLTLASESGDYLNALALIQHLAVVSDHRVKLPF